MSEEATPNSKGPAPATMPGGTTTPPDDALADLRGLLAEIDANPLIDSAALRSAKVGELAILGTTIRTFLTNAVSLAEGEELPPVWYAIEYPGTNVFGVVDFFADEAGR